MVAVLVEYIRSLNQFEIEVEVSLEILHDSYYIFEYFFFLTKKYIDVIKNLIAKLDKEKHTVENIVLLMS